MNSLNEIRLTTEQIIALYGRSLVAISDNTAVKPIAKKQQVAIKYLGNNEKKVTVLVNNPGHTFMPETELTFLLKMIEACRMNMADVAIVNLASFSFPLQQIVAELSPVKIVSFGARPEKTLFAPSQEFSALCLDAPSISEMLGESPAAKHLKSKLWISLKQMFNL